MMISGILGGMAWAAIPAFLKTKYNTNEILTSLMLVYVGLLVLSWNPRPVEVTGWYEFSESRLFHDQATLPVFVSETRLHIGWLIALAVVLTGWIVMARHIIGFQVKVIGMAPMAARSAGFNENKVIWIALMISGGLAGFAGMIEVSGPIGKIQPMISPGYGFTAIIVAFFGKVAPHRRAICWYVNGTYYLGGDAAQIELNLPNAVTGVFQGMLLFYLLASDVLVKYRIRFGPVGTLCI